jgi:hypothetical protein
MQCTADAEELTQQLSTVNTTFLLQGAKSTLPANSKKKNSSLCIIVVATQFFSGSRPFLFCCNKIITESSLFSLNQQEKHERKDLREQTIINLPHSLYTPFFNQGDSLQSVMSGGSGGGGYRRSRSCRMAYGIQV